jgi:hypothetical protein
MRRGSDLPLLSLGSDDAAATPLRPKAFQPILSISAILLSFIDYSKMSTLNDGELVIPRSLLDTDLYKVLPSLRTAAALSRA